MNYHTEDAVPEEGSGVGLEPVVEGVNEGLQPGEDTSEPAMPLPTMDDLDDMTSQLDQIDATLASLDRPSQP